MRTGGGPPGYWPCCAPPPSAAGWAGPARPPDDPGAAICAGVVFAIGLAVITVRGARDPAGE